MRKRTSTNYRNEQQLIGDCPILSTFYFLGGRWKVAILWNLANGPVRFSSFQTALMGISEKMLAQQLKELERDGFVHKTIFAEVPLRTEYTLTELGQSLMPLLQQIHAWGSDHQMPHRFRTVAD